jgi:DNA-binding HxlR family transcriptional regulator
MIPGGEIMSNDSYNQFCPVSKACEIIEPRWTLLILCEMWQGSTRFNEIRRGVPGMSPTLMSKRLKELELRGIINRTEDQSTNEIHYTMTSMGNELQPIIHALGKWAHRNIDADVTLENLDARLLMWNMRRRINTVTFPKRKRTVIQFTYPELPEAEQRYWIIAKPDSGVDLCSVDPGFDVDLFITADLKAMTSAWMGHSTLRAQIALEKIVLIGNRTLVDTIDHWMVRSSMAIAA